LQKAQLEVITTGRNESLDLATTLAGLLFQNGESTQQTMEEVASLSGRLGLSLHISPSWGEIECTGSDGYSSQGMVLKSLPTGVNMGRVTKIRETLNVISHAPPAAAWLFALAAGAGAVALGTLFGLQHFAAAELTFFSASVGAILRRQLARLIDNAFLQPACAALFAGIIGGPAVHFDLSSSLRLVAVCPCMILVAGPHILNSALD
jgi:uncharacterized membrane protein YjjP (DUF1212 family)